MLLSVAEFARDASMCPELAGSRVLITGVGAQSGVDLVRAFGDHGCRLILQIPDPCAETDALLEIVAEAALEVRVHHDDIGKPAEAVKFTQASTKAYGALDVVVNVISFDAAAFEELESFEAIEDEVVVQMQSAARITQVAANRMGLMWSNGLVLNILRMPAPDSTSNQALAGIARALLAAMTRSEAQKWAEQGVRVNAIAPRLTLKRQATLYDDFLKSEPEIAAAALYLASDQGRELTGHILDCDCS